MPRADDIGFRGRRRREFPREHRPVMRKDLSLFNQEAAERLESLLQGMKVTQGITEELKGRDRMAWIGATNNVRACAEELGYADSASSTQQEAFCRVLFC